MTDEYTVSGMKSWVIAKFAKYLAVKEIDQDTVAQLVNAISAYFKDKHEIEILHSLDIVLCKLLMGIRKRFAELSNGEKTEREKRETQTMAKASGSVERKKGLRRKKGRDHRL